MDLDLFLSKKLNFFFFFYRIGESAGAMVSFNIISILNDLTTEYKSKIDIVIPMPDGLVPICGGYLICPTVSPSRLMSSFDSNSKFYFKEHKFFFQF